MTRSSPNTVGSGIPAHRTTEASVKTILLVLVFFLVGLAGGAFLFYRATTLTKPNEAGAKKSIELSASTKAVLRNLDSPVEIRFYAVLDPATVPESVRGFASRVDALLSAYQQEAAGKISLNREASTSASGPAAADGIRPFNIEKGDACFLGLVVAQDKRKEVMAQLAPEWEPALESDLSRTIARVGTSPPPAPASAAQAKSDAAALEEVKRALPNFASISLEEGTRILRQAALDEFKAAAQEMESQLKAAQQRLAAAPGSKSEAEQQAAAKELQALQSTQAEKLKEIAARLPEQIAALRKLKAAQPPAPTK